MCGTQSVTTPLVSDCYFISLTESLFSNFTFQTACNAMETLLIHKDLMKGPFFTNVCQMLKEEGVKLHSGKNLVKQLTFGPPPAKTMKHEYGALECCVEVVDDTEAAIDHIHRFGSSHTDVIVTENGELTAFKRVLKERDINCSVFFTDTLARYFQQQVDSACVFHNSSSR